MVKSNKLYWLMLVMISGCKSADSSFVNRELLIGKWEGHFLKNKVNLIFKDKTVLIDYHNGIQPIERNYRLRGDTLYIDKPEDTSIVKELTRHNLSIEPIHNTMEESIDIVYEIRFAKVPQK
jgi:hypothetical protein